MEEFLSFKRMLTPVIIKVIFWIGIAMCVVVGVSLIVAGGEMVLVGVVVLFLGPLAVRIWCELLIVLFRILDELTMARKRNWGAVTASLESDKDIPAKMGKQELSKGRAAVTETICPQCGTANSFGNKFCQGCGAGLKA